MKRLLAAAAVAALALCACTGGHDPSPRPRAFARANAYGDSLAACTVAGVAFDVNAAAAVATPRPGWADIAYGRHRATLHLSVLREPTPEAMADAMANRSERMSLNLAGRRARVSDFVNAGGFRVRLVDALEPAPVPLQFMAADSGATVFVSGAVAISGPVEPADSASEALADLRRQLMFTLNSLTLCP